MRSRRFPLARWTKRTAAVTLTVLAIAVAVWLLARTQVALGITVAALLIAVALDRPIRWLERHRVRRGIGIALAMLAILAGIAAVVLLLVPPATGQIKDLIEHGPEIMAKVRATPAYQSANRHFGIDQLLASAQGRSPGLARALVDPALTIVTFVVGGLAALVTVLFMVIFMLSSGRQLVWAALAKARPQRRARYASVLRQIYHSLGGYIAGLLVIVLTHTMFAGVFLAILRIPYFLPLAVLAGLCSLIPYAGALIAGAMLAIVAWVNNGLVAALITVGYYIAYQEFENHVITPLVYRRAVDLNPLIIMLAVLFMTELAGVPGALVAVPLAASIQIVVREVLRVRRERLGIGETPPGPEVMHAGEPAESARH